MAIIRPVIGIDLGGTNMQIGVVAGDDRVVGRAKKKTKAAEGAKAVIDRMVEGIHDACKEAGISPRSLMAIGIGAAGAIDPHTGTVVEAPNLRWTNVPLAKTLSAKLGKPVVVDNDVRAAAVGEHRLGAGRGASEMLAVWIGTGIGGGLILRNHLYHGFTNTAGEVGHMTLFPHLPPGTTSVENNCSRSAVVARILGLINTNHKSIVLKLAGNDPTAVKAGIVAEAYIKNDRVTRRVVDDAARNLGIAAANMVTALGLQRIVVGGGLTEAMGETLVGMVRESVRNHAYPTVAKRVEVVMTRLQADAGLLGAAVLAREHKLRKA
ncbi:MAG: ROK family protein [Phycisphaerales bacterium]